MIKKGWFLSQKYLNLSLFEVFAYKKLYHNCQYDKYITSIAAPNFLNLFSALTLIIQKFYQNQANQWKTLQS